MPQRDPGVYLEDIEHYAAAAVRFTSGFSLEQYLADEKTRAAVERVLEVCGEAMSNLYRVAPAVAETIPHARDIIGFGLTHCQQCTIQIYSGTAVRKCLLKDAHRLHGQEDIVLAYISSDL